jgi:Raf kinase inhibitor-like YbhB/YbcL family protein
MPGPLVRFMRNGCLIKTGVAIFFLAAFLILVSGCTSPAPQPGNASGHFLTLSSEAFADGGSIPARYTCDGQGESPPLRWENVPEGTRSFALVVEDPDAPWKPYIHWVIYNIPETTRDLPLDAGAMAQLPGGAVQGKASNGKTGYTGPCPPQGSTHHYIFTLSALDIRLEQPATMDAETFRQAMAGHVLGTAELTGTYRRS